MNDKKYATYQFRLPQDLWNKFKIKSITENRNTYRDTLIVLIEKYVST